MTEGDNTDAEKNETTQASERLEEKSIESCVGETQDEAAIDSMSVSKPKGI